LDAASRGANNAEGCFPRASAIFAIVSTPTELRADRRKCIVGRESSPKVSLASELSVLESAVNGVGVVLEHLAMQAGGGADPRALEGAIGLLAVVGASVRFCRRVVSGAEPARIILAPHNAVTDRHPADDPDVLLA
jgi:hypothetical protein